MKRILIALLAGVMVTSGWAASETDKEAPPNKYAAEVAKFSELPVPAPGGILLVGSSIFRKWTNAAQNLAPLPITNRAFGGSQTAHQLMFFDQVVPPCRPSLVVWYCGSNDIKGKKDPASVLERTEEWIEKVKKSDPSTRILLVSVVRAPQKRRDGQLAAVDAVNKGLQDLCGKKEGVFYVDVNPALQDPAGESKPDLYVEDGLHLTEEGYHQMTKILKPAIEKNWKK